MKIWKRKEMLAISKSSKVGKGEMCSMSAMLGFDRRNKLRRNSEWAQYK
jgi:hypothetical protein